MIPGVLVLSIAAGIVWADIGGRLPVLLVGLWLVFAGGSLSALLVRVRRAANDRNAGATTNQILRVSGMLAAAGLAFATGFDRLDIELSRARMDALRAEDERREVVRVADVRVASRRSGGWGDEIELVSVHAADAGGALPERLILRLDDVRVEPASPSHSRADRFLWPGARVRVGLRISPLRFSRNPGTLDREHHRARRGRAARARLVKPDWLLSLSSQSGGGRGAIDRVRRARSVWRRRVATRLEEEGHGAGLVRALGLGDRGGIRSDTREAFRRLGLSHLLAVSGLHVGLVAGIAGWFSLRASAWVCRRGRNTLPFDWALVIACGATALYAWVTGAGVSVERAAILFVLCAACRLGLRFIAPGVALTWVAVGILLLDPAALYDVGAQLSFGACAALILGGLWTRAASPRSIPEPRWSFASRLAQAGIETFRASLVISLLTAPLLVQHGIVLPLFAPLVNVLAIPLLGLIVLPASLLAVVLVESIPGLAVSLLMLPARAFEAGIVRAAMFLPEPSESARLALPILVLATWSAVIWMRCGSWKGPVAIWVGISLAGSAPGFQEPFAPKPPRVVFFEVGQGDASLVQGRQAVLLIDTGSGPPDGSGGAALVRGLRAMGVDSIDVLVVTHADLDHRAGADRILSSIAVEELWLPISGVEETSLRALSKTAQERGTQIRWLAAGAADTDRGDLEIEVLWPPLRSTSQVLSRNESSLVLRVSLDEMAFLFTADIGREVEAELMTSPDMLSVNVLKVAHHGSRRSSSRAFLEAVSPSFAVVSAPCEPTRGLPSPRALERVRQSGAALWWTGRDGAVIVSRDALGRISATSWGRARRC